MNKNVTKWNIQDSKLAKLYFKLSMINWPSLLSQSKALLSWATDLINSHVATTGLGYANVFESYEASFERKILVPHLNQHPGIKLIKKESYACFMSSIYPYLFLQSTVWAYRTQAQILHAPAQSWYLHFPQA